MNSKGLIVAVVSGGVALGILTATLGSMSLKGQERLAEAIESNRDDIAETRPDIADLRERVARLEGLFEGHLDRDD
ncbi:MAG: hypothetical protein OXN97_04415 [Bryobacterales bacterium]|nr:hypothetical protein [Bryobacterales bacterium]